MNDSEQLENGPDLARWLGFGGLIPFVFCATMAHSGNQQLAAYSLVGIANYGAVILSFVGAVHWGLAMQGERHLYWYAWSITPALLGWAAITLWESVLVFWHLCRRSRLPGRLIVRRFCATCCLCGTCAFAIY